MAACCTYHRPTYFSKLLNRSHTKTNNTEKLSGKKMSGEWASMQEKKDKRERGTGLIRKTKEEIVEWNQMTALIFQTGGRHQTSPDSLQGSLLWSRVPNMNFKGSVTFPKSTIPFFILKQTSLSAGLQ